MTKQVSSTDDIFAKLPAISRSVRNKAAMRVADGERIVFAEHRAIIDSEANLLKRLDDSSEASPRTLRKRAA